MVPAPHGSGGYEAMEFRAKIVFLFLNASPIPVGAWEDAFFHHI